MTELRDLNHQATEQIAVPTAVSDAPVLVERRGHVLMIGVNRAHKRNAWDLATIDAVGAAYERLGSDPDLRVGVVHAVGEHFSAGLDLAEVGPAVAANGPGALSGGHLYDPFGVWAPPVPKPVVMAVQGITYTLSIGCASPATSSSPPPTCASASWRWAAGSCRSAAPPSARSPASDGATRWPSCSPHEEFGADEALRIGLVQRVVPPGRAARRGARDRRPDRGAGTAGCPGDPG